jgi:TolB-like protein/Tfp pilus assembly protein PilF
MVRYGTYRRIFLIPPGPDEISYSFSEICGDRKMAKIAKSHPITIDLNQFKLHIELKNRIELTLHFNSPSRRFYLSVIAFVVNEMKRQGKITSIPLERHHDLLALLNDTIGESAGSSETENLLSRIYRKWQHVLPNLEEAPLFMVLGRKKGYEEGFGKTYHFTETEKDSWANLFEYKGSYENVRLKFAIDKLGATLNDIVIFYEDSLNGEAWEKFVSRLKEKKAEPDKPVSREAEVPAPPLERWRTLLPSGYRWVALMAAIVVVLGAIILAIWKTYLKPDRGDVASQDKMAFPLPDEPSIAVLPFVNMSGDPKQEFLCDGVTEEVITALSKVPRLFVISRQSTFFYKAKPVKVKQVSEELGVRYVLEGGVQKSGDRVRITVQLIDALTGRHLWAERYERDLKDLFALEDEIIIKILTGIRMKLTEGEISSASSKYFKGKQGFDCYLKLMEAYKYSDRHTHEDNNVARRLNEEAISMCPENPVGYAQLSGVYLWDIALGNTKSPREALGKAGELAKKALAIDGSLPVAHSFLSSFYLYNKEYEKAIAEGERAVALDPSGSGACSVYASALLFAGWPEEAIPLYQKAIRLNPNAATNTFVFLGHAFRNAGRFEEAVQAYKKGLQRAPDNVIAHVGLGSTYSLMGREKEARAEAEEILRINPKFSLDYFAKTATPYKDQSEVDKVVNALRKAGLK